MKSLKVNKDKNENEFQEVCKKLLKPYHIDKNESITESTIVFINNKVSFEDLNEDEIRCLNIIFMITGILSKIITMYTLPVILTVVFLISMAGKRVGLGLIGISLYQLSKE
ncbi:MAG: hypothetical protein H5T85_08145 [Actinobacteria bacterium]|nr:hypothetical protein [Actinomycetota bacterium]